MSKKKTSTIETKITNKDKEIDEIGEIEKIIDDELKDLKVSKKKTSTIETKITNEDKEIDEIGGIEKIIYDELKYLKVYKNKTSTPKIIINDDSNEIKEKKVIKKIRIKKSNNNEIWWILLGKVLKDIPKETYKNLLIGSYKRDVKKPSRKSSKKSAF